MSRTEYSPDGSCRRPFDPEDRSRYVRYDVDVWEGLVEAPSVPLTVLPPSDDKVRDAIAKINSDDQTIQPSVDLLRLGRVERAIDPLLRRFNRSLDTGIAEALLAIDAARAGPRLLALFGGIQGRDAEEMRTTRTFVNAALAAPDCTSVPMIVAATGHASGDIVATIGDSLRGFAEKCPELRRELITLLRTPVPVPAAYQGSVEASARRRAADALGRIGNPDDVPLLVAVLRREIPGLPPATSWYGDPVREGAVRALGRLGGAQASAALSEQLNEPGANRFVMPVIVEQLGRLNPPGTVEALARMLDSSDESLLVRVISALRQLRNPSTVPQLLAALSHPNSMVRVAASGALLDLGEAVAPSDIRPSADSPDDGVRVNALFHLARHGDATALPLFVRGITSNVQFEREASVQGISRFGTTETFGLLRAALATAPEGVASYVGLALRDLTFASIQETSLTEWDGWWKTHARRTRLEWAQEALDAASAQSEIGWALLAARYLVHVQPAPWPLIEQSLNHPAWIVRDAAITAVEKYDRTRAARLLLRELDSRYLGACRNAVQRLNALSGEEQIVDCMRRAARERARAHWASIGEAR